jgi:hypothetical protein
VLKDPEGFWALTNRELSVLAVVEEARSAEPGQFRILCIPASAAVPERHIRSRT